MVVDSQYERDKCVLLRTNLASSVLVICCDDHSMWMMIQTEWRGGESGGSAAGPHQDV